MHVSHSGYYRWLKEPVSRIELRDKPLEKQVRDAYYKMKGIYGYRRITILVNRQTGANHSVKRIRRIMIKLGLKAIIRRSRRGCTVSRGDGYYEPNRLNRDFTATHRNEKWVTDVTYLKYAGDKNAYLSAIKDLFTGEIISYVISKRNDNALVMDTLIKAFRDNPDAQPLLHSDRGFQYTSHAYTNFTASHHVLRSMSRVGRCIDNAPMESFWSHYKDEAYERQEFATYEELVASIDRYIYFYNHKRFQTKLNGLTPVEFRDQAA